MTIENYFALTTFSVLVASMIAPSLFYKLFYNFLSRYSFIKWLVLLIICWISAGLAMTVDQIIYKLNPTLQMTRNVQSFIFETSQGFSFLIGLFTFWIPIKIIDNRKAPKQDNLIEETSKPMVLSKVFLNFAYLIAIMLLFAIIITNIAAQK